MWLLPRPGTPSEMVSTARQWFDGSPRSVEQARRFLRTCVEDRMDDETCEDVVLALSEMASNSVQHAGTSFEVVVEVDGQVRIEVEDGSSALPQRRRPTRAPGGRGMHIVDGLCDRWGVHVVQERKCVWCERDLANPA